MKSKKKTGIAIEIIDGKTEAGIIFNSQFTSLFSPKHDYIYVDVGGGSTEVSLIKNEKMKTSTSFNIGTLRMLAGKVKESEWDNLSDWVREQSGKRDLEIIGLGGNINKLYRLADVGKGGKLPVTKLEELRNTLDNMSLRERMLKYDMRPDRADVIVPAANIFLHIAQAGGIQKINVPTMGLVDGIIQKLLEESQK